MQLTKYVLVELVLIVMIVLLQALVTVKKCILTCFSVLLIIIEDVQTLSLSQSTYPLSMAKFVRDAD